MAASLQLNHNVNYVFTSVDSTSLILSNHTQYAPLHSSSSCSYSVMQRGPRYEAYAALRESRLRMKQSSSSILAQHQEEVFDFNFKPIISEKKHVKSNSVTPPPPPPPQQQQQQKRSKGHSSVSFTPEYGIASPIRRENRKSAPPAIVIDQNPKMTLKSKSGTYDGIMGRKSVEKKSNGTAGGGGGLMARKSYAGLEVLKGLGSQARRAINGESNGGMKNINPRRNCNFDRSEFGYSTHF